MHAGDHACRRRGTAQWRRIVLVEDVVSSGGAIVDFTAKLCPDGIAVPVALCVIDRETGGRAACAPPPPSLDWAVQTP